MGVEVENDSSQSSTGSTMFLACWKALLLQETLPGTFRTLAVPSEA